MSVGNEKLKEIAEQISKGKPTEKPTVRTFLLWFDAQRRGGYIVAQIRSALSKHRIQTKPDFEFAYIDSLISFEKGTVEKTAPGVAIGDPTQRIGKLASANRSPVTVKPDSTLTEVITIMLSHDFSQLPVMTSDRDVKGMVSWSSIGSRLSLQRDCKFARDFMENHYEISSDTSLFDAIDSIVGHEYVLIRDSERKITGIVTTSDLSLQFRQLGEPFLLLGEIENHIRRLIGDKYTIDQLRSVCDPAEPERVPKNVNDLTFGEYIRLLQNPDHWAILKLGIDRALFVSQLDRVREIRNDVMHFDPDGIGESDIKTLREFVQFLQGLRKINAI